MPHVVIMGPGLPPEDLRPRLARWGMTSAGAEHVAGGSLPTVHDCDAVLWFGESPSAAADAGGLPAAPVLLVADGDAPTWSWRTVPARKIATDALRRSLEACFARARELRELASGEPLRLAYRDFLGHELRTPLTALRTALEEIAAAPDDAGPLPGIALRNVERLQQVIEWSHDVLALAGLPEAVAAPLLASLVAEAPWIVEPDAEPASA